RTLLTTMRGHMGPIRSVAFSPDGTLLASGSDDHTVRFWDIPTGSLRRTLHGHTRWVFALAFNPGGEVLASGSEDGSIIFWKVESGSVLKVRLLDRQYERTNITGARGLTDGQRAALRALGAVDHAAATGPARP